MVVVLDYISIVITPSLDCHNIVILFVIYTLYAYSMYMYIVSRKSNLSKEITLGSNQLNFATSCKYFGHVISNNLSDESGIQTKVTLVCQEKYFK